jgi:hypothetical protein
VYEIEEPTGSYSVTRNHQVTLRCCVGPTVSLHVVDPDSASGGYSCARLTYLCGTKGDARYMQQKQLRWSVEIVDPTAAARRAVSVGNSDDEELDIEDITLLDDNNDDGADLFDSFDSSRTLLDTAQLPLSPAQDEADADVGVLRGSCAEIKAQVKAKLIELIRSQPDEVLLVGQLRELSASLLAARASEYRFGTDGAFFSGRRVPLPFRDLSEPSSETTEVPGQTHCQNSSRMMTLQQDGTTFSYPNFKPEEHKPKIVYQVSSERRTAAVLFIRLKLKNAVHTSSRVSRVIVLFVPLLVAQSTRVRRAQRRARVWWQLKIIDDVSQPRGTGEGPCSHQLGLSHAHHRAPPQHYCISGSVADELRGPLHGKHQLRAANGQRRDCGRLRPLHSPPLDVGHQKPTDQGLGVHGGYPARRSAWTRRSA